MNQRQRLLEQIRQQSIQKRAQALREAAQRQANNAPIANAAAGASSGGGRRGCTERDGLTMTWKSPWGVGPGFTFIQRVFLPYTGQDKSGNATFALVTDRYTFDGQDDEFIVRVSKSGDQWLLEFVQASIEGTQVEVAAQSADLYEGWVGLEEYQDKDKGRILQDITATCGDQTYRRLCITTQDSSPFGTYTTITGGVESIIPEISEEYPSGYGGIDKVGLLWVSEFGAWTVYRTIVGEADDISQPPTGQFDTGRGQVTIVEGSCTGDVPTPPEPTLVTTSDIQLSTTTWTWNSFSGTGQSAGSIGSFLIDGQSGYVEGGGLPPLSPYVFQTTPGVGPNQYTITLLPSAMASLGIGMTSYDLVSMVLNITVGDGTSPISGGSTGVITAISGTITYEKI
jgi:hypothetical protein